MRFILLVEGKTEKKGVGRFLKKWLDPRLSQPVKVAPVRVDNVDDLIKKAEEHLQSPKQDKIIAVVGLLDLYGLPLTIPDDKASILDKCKWARYHIEKKVGDKRFLMHFAVHETEAWLLSDPRLLPPSVRKALPGRAAKPETVDFDEPPGALLRRLYREKEKRDYIKAVDGPALFLKLDPANEYKRLPYLKTMLEDMLKLAKTALS